MQTIKSLNNKLNSQSMSWSDVAVQKRSDVEIMCSVRQGKDQMMFRFELTSTNQLK